MVKLSGIDIDVLCHRHSWLSKIPGTIKRSKSTSCDGSLGQICDSDESSSLNLLEHSVTCDSYPWLLYFVGRSPGTGGSHHNDLDPTIGQKALAEKLPFWEPHSGIRHRDIWLHEQNWSVCRTHF